MGRMITERIPRIRQASMSAPGSFSVSSQSYPPCASSRTHPTAPTQCPASLLIAERSCPCSPGKPIPHRAPAQSRRRWLRLPGRLVPQFRSAQSAAPAQPKSLAIPARPRARQTSPPVPPDPIRPASPFPKPPYPQGLFSRGRSRSSRDQTRISGCVPCVRKSNGRILLL